MPHPLRWPLRSPRRRLGRAAIAAALAFLSVAGVAGDGPLHVASPDWRDQVIYFAMIDRFADGDPGNNDQGAGEYDPGDGRRYSGGDLAGLRQRLDYIAGLGATALWTTPQVAGQWWSGSYGGYHGYWASDFKAVDAHYGRLQDYQALSRDLHARGMYLVQDVVVNHTADYLRCAPGDGSPAERCAPRTDVTGHSAPQAAPFDRNDPRDPAQLDAAIYHWTPPIADFSDRHQELDFQLADLDDLNTENPVVRRALRDAYGWWIRNAGVDAFRVDTAYHVPAEFFTDFLHAEDPAAPGMAGVAAATGRHDFLVFGEGFGADRAFDDSKARKLDAYMRVPGGLPSMIDFPLYGTLADVFARGRPPAELAHRVGSRMALHADPHRMPTFVDNHDVERFLNDGNEAGLRQALLALMTLPGIPVIWQGTEQGFTEQRAALFAGGHGSGGRDHFDTGSPLYRYLRAVIALRRGNAAFSRGVPAVLAANTAAPGALAWRMDHEGMQALVVFNTSDGETLLDGLETGLAAGTRLRGAFSIDGVSDDAVVGPGGRMTLVLPPRSGRVWLAGTAGLRIPEVPPAPVVDALVEPVPRGDFDVQGGSAAAARQLQLVVDGDLASARPVPVDARGRWRGRVSTGGMTDPSVVHRVVAWDAAAGVASVAREFRVEHAWRLLADIADPAGDDHGPAGRYKYPTRSDWARLRPADIERVRVWGASGALRLEITLPAISTAWNPTNGFDRVAFTAFVQLPDRSGGVAAMPLQNASLPGGMRWHVRLRAHGWSNALTSSRGASAGEEGTPVTPVADLAVDAKARTVTFTLPSPALGNPQSLSGARLYVTTWDYDGGFRALSQEAGEGHFGGGDGRSDPLWMDASEVIELP
jgi:glycosidase